MRSPIRIRTLLAAVSVLALTLPALSAQARQRPLDQACMDHCQQVRVDCRQACSADFIDCMRGSRLEMRACRQDCAGQFDRGTTEFADCVTTCRGDIILPAKESCGALRGECQPQCRPGACRRHCGPGGGNGGMLPPLNECTAACASDLRDCARSGREQLATCVAPCKELTDADAKQACLVDCATQLQAGHDECRGAFDDCVGVCNGDQSTTTTTLEETTTTTLAP